MKHFTVVCNGSESGPIYTKRGVLNYIKNLDYVAQQPNDLRVLMHHWYRGDYVGIAGEWSLEEFRKMNVKHVKKGGTAQWHAARGTFR